MGDSEPIKEKRSAIIHGNNYNESLIQWGTEGSKSAYHDELIATSTFEAAKQIHKKQLTSASSLSIKYYLEAYAYFKKMG